MANAVSPRYASVLPPPVGKNRRSTRPSIADPLRVARVRERGQVQQHERELERPPGPVLGNIGVCHGGVQLERSRPAAAPLPARVCTRCCHIAWLANRNASATSGSLSAAIPARIRARRSRAPHAGGHAAFAACGSRVPPSDRRCAAPEPSIHAS